MTTFTTVAEGVAPTLSIDSSREVSKINPNIYGGFTEHMGRCIYGGLYEPGSPLADEDGFRKDVIEALKELKVPVVRYPGGNFCATWHWKDGIGPKDQRPARPELAWLGTESNQFGTDEFMKWCKVVGTEPYMCLNMGTGTLDEAMQLVEYCNSDKNTYYANLRRKNGHEKSYNVKYWSLGNEPWGDWQIMQDTKEDYAKKAHQWAKALKLLDPSIELIICGETGNSSWDYHVLQHAITHASMHSIHFYTASEDHLENVTAPLSAERSIQITSGLIDLARIERKIPASVPRQTICFDEWNVWDPVRAPGDKGAEEIYTLSDALAVAVWLNVFIRQSKDVGMANIAQSCNVISPLMTTKEGIWKQPSWWPLLLFSNYMQGSTISVHLTCSEYTGPTNPAWIRSTSIATPWLDTSAALDKDGFVNLVVVNIHPEKDLQTDLKGIAAGKVETFVITGDSPKAKEVHLDEKGNGYKKGSWDASKDGGKFTFTKHSITMLRWDSKAT